MRFGRSWAGAGALAVLVVAAVMYAASPVKGFDYQDSPSVIANPGTDLADAYLFPSPVNANNVVAVMTIHPGLPAGTANSAFFNQSVLYEMKFDLKYQGEAVNARPVVSFVLQVSAGLAANGTQQIFVYGPGKPIVTGNTSKLLNGGTPSAVGYINHSFSTFGGITMYAGVREDPFFFDLSQFYNIIPDRNQGSTASSCLPAPVGNGSCPQGFNPPGTATDFFGNTNVLAIVAEIPISTMQSQNFNQIAYWATASTTSGH